MFDGAIPYAVGKLADYLKEGMTDFIIDYTTAFPILAVISLGVYALVGMISKRLANLGVVGVFLYGSLVIIA